jgi:LemA protein
VKRLAIVLPVLLALAIVAGSKYSDVRRELLQRRAVVDAQWTAVDAAIDGRAGLLPSLDEMVRPVAAGGHANLPVVSAERTVLSSARTPLERMAANERISTAIARLMLAAEGSSQLRSDPEYLRLLDELADAENRVAIERRRYNETLQRYNTSIELFPNNIVARLSGFARNGAYFRTVPGGRSTPSTP